MVNPIDLLVFRARFQPSAIALQEPDRQLTYLQLLRLVKKIGGSLRRQGLRPGQIVVTAFSDRFIDWILTLALIHEALVSCSNQGYAPVQAFEFDWMLTDRGDGPHAPADKTIVIDNTWLREVQRRSADLPSMYYESEASPFRLILTSGTTGISKGVLYSVGHTLENTRQHAWNGDHSRVLVLFGMSSGVGFRSGLYALVTGFPYYCSPDMDGNIALVRKFGIGSVAGAPVQLARMVEELDRTGSELPSLESVRSGGGAVSRQLLASLTGKLCPNVFNNYGSTEVGNTCLYRPAPDTDEIPVGYALPGVEVQVVGAEQEPLPPDTEGTVRVRARFMASGYYRNDEATRERFRDSWFYPGDRGLLSADGCLQLSGRDSELMNLGGVKINPDSVDQFVLAFPGVRDAAAFSVESELGVERIALALASETAVNLKALAEALTRKFGSPCRLPLFVKMQQIPRTQMGKVRRKDLRERLQARLAANARAEPEASG